MAVIIDGKSIARNIKDELKQKVNGQKQMGRVPALAVVIVGNDPASRVYVNGKKKACEEIGIKSLEYSFDDTVTEEMLLELIDTLNGDKNIHGILVQLPLPKGINSDRIIEAIHPDKDVDCFHPQNLGRLMAGNPLFLPCTPAGIIELIERSGVVIAGKECVIVGRSNIVGKPIAMMLLAKHGTVTLCHSKTMDLQAVCKRADILVAAIGKTQMLTKDYIKPGAVVIDVGINRQENGKLLGDVNYEDALTLASHITPVPGGVGPMTIAMLMKNTLRAFEAQQNHG